jgi:hypothetical protein
VPSFETDVVLRGLIEQKIPARIGPDHLGPSACIAFAIQLGVSSNQLWGAICNLRYQGRIQTVPVPDTPLEFALMPTYRGECYFRAGAHKQPYSLQTLVRCSPVSA